MSSDLLISLQITAVGMGLVFASIILLWGLIAMIVWLAHDKPLQPESPLVGERDDEYEERINLELAAVAAVSVALAIKTNESPPPAINQPVTAPNMVSAWQAVMRTKMLNKRGSIR